VTVVRRFIAVAAVLVCALAAASVVLAASFGANDDGATFAADDGEAFYTQMAALGLRQSVVGVRWQPSDPLTIPRGDTLDKIVPVARKHGVKVVLALFPYPPREIEAGLGTPQAFGAWAASVAQRYPQVRQYVVGNEPNQPAFWRPQFGSNWKNVSARRFGAYLAAAYDALKGVDPAITVIGVGLSPRGNDKPNAASNISTSPIRFLAALGAWYRTSGRTAPLMDGFSFHPYPNKATDALETGYVWPGAGVANLGRVKQALWDAFHDTQQPTTLNGLGLYLDEVGWQVNTSYLAGYDNLENVPVTDELTQADTYAKLVRRAQCDPDVAEVNIFGFVDDRDRRGFQAALFRADGTPRPAAEAVRSALEEPANCPETAPWQPTTEAVVGAGTPRVASTKTQIVVTTRVGEGVAATVCTYPRSVSPVTASRLPARAGGIPATCVRAKLTPQRLTPMTMVRSPELSGGGTIGLRLVSEANGDRRTTFAVRFR
jgi:hypothetical protein